MAYALIEPTGCGEFHGNVVARIAFYLEPDDPRYDERHYLVPIIPKKGYPGEVDAEGNPINQADYNAWLESLPKKWVLAPFHNHFLYLPPDVTEDTIIAKADFHLPNFYAAWLQELDKIKGGMRKGWATETRGRPIRYDKVDPELYAILKPQCLEKAQLIKALAIEVKRKEGGQLFPSTEIDIGSPAIDRTWDFAGVRTIIVKNNPANNTGKIDEVEIYPFSGYSLVNCRVATFISEGGDVLSTRDYEIIGAVPGGSKQTFSGKDMDVVAGDYIGLSYDSGGRLEATSGGYQGVWRIGTAEIPCSSVTFNPHSASTISLYGTGETPPVDLPTVTAQAASSVEATTATTNGNITNTGGENCDKRGVVYDTSTHGDPGDVAPGASGYANFAEDTDGFGTGAFTKAISSLPPGTTIYYRMYAHNSAGYDYSNTEITFLTKPAAPTNVAATDGDHTDKVVITWTKSTGATQYQVYRDGSPLGWLGDVATYDDTGAGAPSITPGDAVASDGAHEDKVALYLSGEGTSNGATHTYKVRAKNATGESADSGTNTGYRGVGSLTYQWQRSAADSDADYSNIDGATTEAYDDTGAPADGSGRYYRCVENATGAAQQISAVDRGYRGILKTSSDTGLGSDALVALLATLAKTDSGVGVEGIVDRELALADAGVGAEVISARSLMAADSGVGLDAALLTIVLETLARYYMVEVHDSSGNLLVFLENAYGVSLVEQLNRPPMLDFNLPANDGKISHIDPDNEIWLRDYETGALVKKFLLGRRMDTR